MYNFLTITLNVRNSKLFSMLQINGFAIEGISITSSYYSLKNSLSFTTTTFIIEYIIKAMQLSLIRLNYLFLFYLLPRKLIVVK